MTAKRDQAFSLAAAVRDPGFTPRARDVAALFDLLADEESASDAERALARIPGAAMTEATARLGDATEPLRHRIAALLGRIAAADPSSAASTDAGATLVRLVASDASPRARKAAAIALGRLGPSAPAEAASALAAALASSEAPELARALVAALGKIGGEVAADAVRSARPEHGGKAASRAATMIERSDARRTPSRFLADRAAMGPTPVLLECRSGLERLLASELEPALRPRAIGPGRVEATLVGPPSRLFRARTMLSFAFPLAATGAQAGDDVAEALSAALAQDETAELLRHFTEGPLRFRIAWAGGGKHRAVAWKVAEILRERRPELVNDPSESPWTAVVRTGRGQTGLSIQLAPRVEDPRFAYRVGDVPAASHPTIAAAIVLVAGAMADDVVWDPFVGSGVELCERALAGPYRALVGSDRSDHALGVARANLEAAGAEAELVLGDARAFTPRLRPTAILTNPPMGRRVARSEDLGALFDAFFAHAAATLAPAGRLVFVSPLPDRTASVALRQGLRLTLRQPVDMGGFEAELQRFDKPAARPATRDRDPERGPEGGRRPAPRRVRGA